MSSENKARLISALATLLLIAAAVGVMVCTTLGISTLAPMQADRGEIVLDEEFVEVLEMPMAPNLTGEEQATANADEMLDAQPTPASGTDIGNAGEAGDPTPPIASKAESPVKTKTEKPVKTGPSAEEVRQQEEKRQAENEITNAFSHAKGTHNTANNSNDKGNAGKPDSQSEQGSYTGNGTGKAGGGWSLPKYGAVQSNVTGSIEMTVTINRQGKVTNVSITGGKAPAATNKAVRDRCIIEVKSRQFHRTNPDDAPETATAYVTYIFQ